MLSSKKLPSRSFAVCLGFVLALLVVPVFAQTVTKALESVACQMEKTRYDTCKTACDAQKDQQTNCTQDDDLYELCTTRAKVEYQECIISCGSRPSC